MDNVHSRILFFAKVKQFSNNSIPTFYCDRFAMLRKLVKYSVMKTSPKSQRTSKNYM